VPAWQTSAGDVVGGLRRGERGATARRSSLRSLFVIVQVSAAVALLVVTGLLIRSFEHVRRVELGFDPENVLTFRVDLPAPKYDSVEKTSRFIEDLVRALAAVPGVEAVGAATAVPLVAGPSYIMRIEGRPPATLGPALRAAVRAFDPTQPVHTLKPMTQLVTESLAQRRFALVLLLTFAAVALALAAVGLYGVVAYSVAQRTREFGVRIALGAGALDVVRLVLREGVVLIGLGLLLGIFAALALGQLVQSMLFGVEPHDPATFIAIVGLLALVALAACLIPAWRATRVDPATALRAE
jgi:putative ABC transport system permease protein